MFINDVLLMIEYLAAILSSCPSCYTILGMPKKMALEVFTSKKENHTAGKNLSAIKRGQKMSMLDPRIRVQHTMSGE